MARRFIGARPTCAAAVLAGSVATITARAGQASDASMRAEGKPGRNRTTSGSPSDLTPDPVKRREFIRRIAAPIAKRTDGRAQRQLRDAVADVLFPGWRTLAKELRKGANQERRLEQQQAEATKAKARAARKAKARPRDAVRTACVACGITRQVRDDSGRCVNRSRCDARASRKGRATAVAA